ncbi:MAG: sigma-70 family RNA polymerase sigma factor [Planctomycetota bacterium]
MSDERQFEVTDLLEALGAGDPDAADRLLPLVYDELRRLARREMARRDGPQTLEPTALVHEAFMRLAAAQGAGFEHRRHFFDVAAKAMRRLLVDHHRAKGRLKRGGERDRVPLDEALPADPVRGDLVALDAALSRLEALHPEHARVVELRFFGGLDVAETAEVLGVSDRTVKRHWRFARAWLIDAMH